MARTRHHHSTSKRRHSAVRFLRWLLILLVLAGGLLAGAVYWLSGAPRSLPLVEGLIASEMNSMIAPFHADIDHLSFQLDQKSLLLATEIENVLVKDEAGKPVARVPKIRLNLFAPALLVGQTIFKRLEISSPRLHVRRDDSGALSLSVENEEGAEVTAPFDLQKAVAGFADSARQMRIRQLVLTDVLVGIDRADGSIQRWELPKVSLRFSNPLGKLQLTSTTLIKQEDFNTKITTVSTIDAADDNSQHELKFQKLPARLITMMSPSLAKLEGLHMLLSGSAVLEVAQHDIHSLQFSVEGKDGEYENPIILPEKIALTSIAASGELKDNASSLVFDNAEIVTPDVTVTASGGLGFADEMTADMELAVTSIPLGKVEKYWPMDVNAEAREWVTSNLRDGRLEKATARILIKPGDLSAEETPSSLLLANLTVRDATVQYLPKYPPVKNVNGEVEITAKGLTITADKGTMLTGTELKKADLAIEDFAAPGAPMSAILDLVAPASDIATFMGPDILNAAQQMKFNPATIQGTGEGHIELYFPLFSATAPEGHKDITYDIDATLSGLGQDSVLGQWNIRDMNGKLKLTNEKVTLETTTTMQSVPATLNVTSWSGKSGRTEYQFKATMPNNKLKDFKFTPPDFLSGTLGIDALIKETAKETRTEATIDLQKAAVAFEDIGLRKRKGTPGTLKATIVSDAQKEIIPSFELASPGITVKGAMTKDKKTQEILSLTIPTLKFGKMDAAITYEQAAGGRQVVKVSGTRLDLSGEEEEGPTDTSPTAKPAEPTKAPATDESPLDKLKNISVTLGLGSLYFEKDGFLKDVRGTLECGPVTCSSAHLSATTENGKPFNFRLDSGAARTVSMNSPDAGGVLKAFGITDHMIGGVLSYNATFADNEAGRPQKGRVLITDFTLANAPILTRIVSLASITGVLDLLSGKGLSFKKFAGDTSFDAHTARISKGKAYGSALGLTFSGYVKPFAETLSIKGTVVPSYTANSMLGNIPILGNLLVGGEGEGIIAARYSVKGNVDNPDVMVNPLSLLTPGFLRNLFDVFDAPENPPPAAPKENTKP